VSITGVTLQSLDRFTCRERKPWHDPSLSFNPAVHRIKQALFHAAIVPNLIDHPVPLPHPELTRYFDSPSKLIKKSRQPLEECKRVFGIAPVPKKVAKRKAEMHVAAKDDDDDLILAPSKKFRRISPGHEASTAPTNDPVDKNVSSVGDQHNLSETESETGDDNRQEDAKMGVLPGQHEQRSTEVLVPRSSGAGSDVIIDHAVPKGRIVGSIYPLDDFKVNLNSGDVVTKAVEDLAFIVQEIALQPFAERRHDELVECLKEMRNVCLREDEVDLWNEWASLLTIMHQSYLIT
jgi:ATP-dependent DNA helicase 2 subunit 2